MSSKGRQQTTRKPATKFAHLRKKMEKNRVMSKIGKKKRSALTLAHEKGFHSIAFPLIGAGSGGFNQDRARNIMEEKLGKMDLPMEVRVVVFGKA